MKQIQEGVRAWLELAVGVKAVADRTRVRGEYPLLAVSVREDGTVLLDGGCQAEHTYQVTVTAVSDRDREGSTALLAGLPAVLLRGIPMELDGERRTLHPLGIATEGEKLTFSLVRCVPVPPLSRHEEPGPGLMRTLHLGL